jgi:hypothetical protein
MDFGWPSSLTSLPSSTNPIIESLETHCQQAEGIAFRSFLVVGEKSIPVCVFISPARASDLRPSPAARTAPLATANFIKFLRVNCAMFSSFLVSCH